MLSSVLLCLISLKHSLIGEFFEKGGQFQFLEKVWWGGGGGEELHENLVLATELIM